MTDIIKPPFDIHEEEDPFLIPPGQLGSYVDTLAAAPRLATPIHIRSTVEIIVLVVLEVRRWTFR